MTRSDRAGSAPGTTGKNRPIVSISPEDRRYPVRLGHLHDPPGLLHCRGDFSVLGRPTVAIVGSRRSTRYGRRAARALARSAARAGWTVVSGLALGIDAAGHEGSLEGGGPTVAVLGSGPDRAYPRSNEGLMERILATGLVVSEYEAGVTPRAYHFPRRNRILAALADRVVVVEAARRSGALITAGLAAELGRDVWAVPGSIFSQNTGGTHRLLEDGATPVTSLEAWRESLGGGAPSTAPAPRTAAEDQLALGPAHGKMARQVWEALASEARSLDALSIAVGANGRELLPVLATMELDGWLERGPGPRFARRLA